MRNAMRGHWSRIPESHNVEFDILPFTDSNNCRTVTLSTWSEKSSLSKYLRVATRPAQTTYHQQTRTTLSRSRLTMNSDSFLELLRSGPRSMVTSHQSLGSLHGDVECAMWTLSPVSALPAFHTRQTLAVTMLPVPSTPMQSTAPYHYSGKHYIQLSSFVKLCGCGSSKYSTTDIVS